MVDRGRGPECVAVDFDLMPRVVGWETTRGAYKVDCGGSRARAWALTGDPLAADPLCAYEPGEPMASLPPLAAIFGDNASLAESLAGALA